MSRFYPSAGLIAAVFIASSLFAQNAAGQKPANAATAAANSGAISANETNESQADDNPVTVKSASDSTSKKPGDNDPLFGVPPLPKGKTSLVGELAHDNPSLYDIEPRFLYHLNRVHSQQKLILDEKYEEPLARERHEISTL